MINRNRADDDRNFKVSISGLSRARWSIAINVLSQWLEQSRDLKDSDDLAAVKDVIHALESHVFGDYDGFTYSLPPGQSSQTLSEVEIQALVKLRHRCAEAKKASEAFAKKFELELRKAKRQASKTTQSKKS